MPPAPFHFVPILLATPPQWESDEKKQALGETQITEEGGDRLPRCDSHWGAGGLQGHSQDQHSSICRTWECTGIHSPGFHPRHAKSEILGWRSRSPMGVQVRPSLRTTGPAHPLPIQPTARLKVTMGRWHLRLYTGAAGRAWQAKGRNRLGNLEQPKNPGHGLPGGRRASEQGSTVTCGRWQGCATLGSQELPLGTSASQSSWSNRANATKEPGKPHGLCWKKGSLAPGRPAVCPGLQ